MKRYKISSGCDTLGKNTNPQSVSSFGHEWQRTEELIQRLPEKLDCFYTAQGDFGQADMDDLHRARLLLNEAHKALDRIHTRH